MPGALGFFFLKKGIENAVFGPQALGIFLLIISFVLIAIIIVDWLEQIVNNTAASPTLTDCDQQRSYRAQGFTWEELEALNTPDPNLIHPDDAKRQRLDIKV